MTKLTNDQQESRADDRHQWEKENPATGERDDVGPPESQKSELFTVRVPLPVDDNADVMEFGHSEPRKRGHSKLVYDKATRSIKTVDPHPDVPASEPVELRDIKPSHLMDWLSEGYTHCQYGSKDWCESYLHGARDYIVALEAALATPSVGWKPLETAKKDGTRVLLLLKNPLPVKGRDDLEHWNGLAFVGRHPGLADDGFDIGWNFAAPVGHGGFPDDWFVGWQPLPAAPESPNE